MNEAKVHVIDMGFRSGYGTELCKHLQSCKSPRVLLQVNRIGPPYDSSNAHSVESMLFSIPPQVIFMILPDHPSPAAQSLTREIAEKKHCPMVAVLETDDPEEAIAVLRLGVNDFILPPLNREDVLSSLLRSLQPRDLHESLLKRCREKIALKRLIGDDRAFCAEIGKIPVLASCDASVLISGETGTGKELCARAVHYLSTRLDKPFVPVNCGALPLDLVENELFGHEKGAFTSAVKSYPGMIHEADKGTLFLDEVNSLPFHAQSKLLRLLQDGEYRQLGSTKLLHADVRVIAAANVDLASHVSEAKFRNDLYYRLNIIPIHLPPLRERRGDIPLLAQHFLNKYAEKYHSPVGGFSDEALERLSNYDWPGNIRELENIIHRVVVFCRKEIVEGNNIGLPQEERSGTRLSFKEAKSLAVSQFEKKYLHELLLTHRGNISKAARDAQKHRRAFWELIRKYEMNIENYLPQSQHP